MFSQQKLNRLALKIIFEMRIASHYSRTRKLNFTTWFWCFNYILASNGLSSKFLQPLPTWWIKVRKKIAVFSVSRTLTKARQGGKASPSREPQHTAQQDGSQSRCSESSFCTSCFQLLGNFEGPGMSLMVGHLGHMISLLWSPFLCGLSTTHHPETSDFSIWTLSQGEVEKISWWLLVVE